MIVIFKKDLRFVFQIIHNGLKPLKKIKKTIKIGVR